MSDLLIILIILGAFIIVGVLVYNWLQERKLHLQVSNEFIVPQKDVLAEDFYIDADAFVEKELAELSHKAKRTTFDEPVDFSEQSEEIVFKDTVLEDDEVKESLTKETVLNETLVGDSLKEVIPDEPTTAEVNDSYLTSENYSNFEIANQPSDIEPSIEKLNQEKASEEKANEIEYTPPQLPSDIHPQIDLTAILFANQHISYRSLHDMAASIDDIALPMRIYGLDDGNKWHLLETNKTSQLDGDTLTFKQVTCSLQLADRGGPAAKNVLNKFQFAVESMGLELNAHVEWQGSGDVMQRAIEIDQFCIEVDQLINIHIAQDEIPIHGTKFRGLAEASGMTLNPDGKFYYQDNNADKSPLFSAIEANNQAFTAESLRNSVLKAITFQLEIPKVPNCELAFNQMIIMTKKLSNSLNANLVDDNQKPLTDLQIEKIRQQLKVIHSTMVARGVMPGSPASMRLFN